MLQSALRPKNISTTIATLPSPPTPTLTLKFSSISWQWGREQASQLPKVSNSGSSSPTTRSGCSQVYPPKVEEKKPLPPLFYKNPYILFLSLYSRNASQTKKTEKIRDQRIHPFQRRRMERTRVQEMVLHVPRNQHVRRHSEPTALRLPTLGDGRRTVPQDTEETQSWIRLCQLRPRTDDDENVIQHVNWSSLAPHVRYPRPPQRIPLRRLLQQGVHTHRRSLVRSYLGVNQTPDSKTANMPGVQDVGQAGTVTVPNTGGKGLQACGRRENTRPTHHKRHTRLSRLQWQNVGRQVPVGTVPSAVRPALRGRQPNGCCRNEVQGEELHFRPASEH